MKERSLIILKPDTVSRGLIGPVTSRLEQIGFKLVGCKMSQLSRELLEEHYTHLTDKPFFADIVAYMQSAPVLLQVREGDDAAVTIRKIVGVTDPAQAAPGTIRGDYAISIARNVIHASEDATFAQEEIARFFTAQELYTYTRCDEAMLYETDR